MVPNGWEFGVIEDIAQVSSGGTPSRANDSYWTDGLIPWVTTAEVKFGTITDTEQKITEEGLKNSSAKLFPKDTILMAMYGQGKTRGQVAKLGIEASTNQACAALQLHEGFDVDYYYQYLISQYENIRELANSGGQQNLSGGIVKRINIPIPPLLEQQKIANILSTWDKAIGTTERLIDNNTQQKKALMQQLLTGKKRLLDESGKRFEGDWEDTKLENIIHLLSGHAFKSSEFEKHTGFKLLRGINISRGFLRWGSEQTFTWSDAEKYERYLLKINDIVVSMDGSLVGRNYALIQQKNFEPMLLVQRVARIRCKDTLSPTYLLQHISSKRFESYVDSVKTVTAIPHISAKDIREFRVPLASIEEQQKIATVLTNADKEIELLEQQLADLQQEKKALMQVLLTGKKRVKAEKQ